MKHTTVAVPAARGRTLPGVRAAWQPRRTAALGVALRPGGAAPAPSRRLVGPAPGRSRRSGGFIVGLLALTFGCAPAAPDHSAVFDGSGGRWIDLTHDVSADAVFWPTADPFVLDTVAHGMTEGGYFYAAFNFASSEHGGTHIDAPIHFAEGRISTEGIPLSALIGPVAVIRDPAGDNPDHQVGVDALSAWEARHGPIPPGTILLLDTGWAGRWPDPVRYLGSALRGEEAVAELHFPGLDPEAARWLVDNRDIAAVGLDTPSIDYGQSSGFESHRILYEENIPGYENVASMAELPEWGAFVVALPMKIAGGSGGPLRIVAFVPG